MTCAGNQNRGRIFVISGPSGSGKTSIVERLRELPGLFYSVSVTSRPPRSGEADGVDYNFVSREEFERMLEDSLLAEYAEVAGNLYGTPREPLEKALREGSTALVDIDVQGAMQIKRAFPEARLVFIKPPGMADLEERLRGRGTDSEETIQSRLELAKHEMEFMPQYDVVVANDELEKAVESVKKLVMAG